MLPLGLSNALAALVNLHAESETAHDAEARLLIISQHNARFSCQLHSPFSIPSLSSKPEKLS